MAVVMWFWGTSCSRTMNKLGQWDKLIASTFHPYTHQNWPKYGRYLRLFYHT